MPKVLSAALRDAFVRSAKPGRYADGNGLYLKVKPTLSRSWLFIGTWGGKRRSVGLGPYPVVTLAKAREKAMECQRLIREGVDPSVELTRQRAKASGATSFNVVATAYIDGIASDFSNAKHLQQWRNTLRTYCKPIASLDVSTITTDDVLKCLQPIWSEKPETARRVRGRIERVLDAATVRGLRTGDNPARWSGHLKALLPNKRPRPRHHSTIPYKSLPEVYGAISSRDGMGALALRFAIMTAARSGEVRGMKWNEVDLSDALWHVPAARMKARRDHFVPLNWEALAILNRVAEVRNGPLVFPGNQGNELSDMTLSAVFKRMGLKATPHGVARSSFRDFMANETEFPRELIEESLAHVLPAYEGAYRRGYAIDRRRYLMNTWADYIKPRQTHDEQIG
ncbi:MAG: tyrosine-type recombinase/integrase [Henriciella sp.]